MIATRSKTLYHFIFIIYLFFLQNYQVVSDAACYTYKTTRLCGAAFWKLTGNDIRGKSPIVNKKFVLVSHQTTMLQPFLYKLNAQRNILASGSPRRKQILENVGLKIDVIPSTFEENLDKSKFTPQEYVIETAKLKTTQVAERLSYGPEPLPDLIIGCDTIVYQDNQIIEKPRDKVDAFRILNQLSGRCHSVFSGFTLFVPAYSEVLKDGASVLDSKFRCVGFVEQTDVFMTEMSPEVINAYIETGEPMDKAGGYGIQAIGGTLVSKIHGDNFNVMGFPLPRFAKELARIYSQ